VIDSIDVNEINDTAEGLIRDRTQADVDYALSLERSMTYAYENLKGAYNPSDRNRVGIAVNRIVEYLRHTGRYEIGAKIKQDWNAYDIAKPGDNGAVLALLRHLKSLLPYDQTENVPDSLDGLTYQKANAVENILYELYGAFSRLLESWLYCGDGHASEFDPFNWQGWDDAAGNHS